MKKIVITSCKFLILFTLIGGGLYTLLVTGIGQLLFPHQANGSIIFEKQTNKPIGSSLIGQKFKEERYFHGRDQEVSKLSPVSEEQQKQVQKRVELIKQENPQSVGKIPIDLVTSSASGLDPDISGDSARYQVPRIAKARGVSENKIYAIIKEQKKGSNTVFIQNERLNVLMLNAALDNEFS